MKTQEKKKYKYIDDGHTIYNMDVDGMPKRRIMNNSKGRIVLNKRERRAYTKAAFLKLFPIFLIVLIAFSVVYILIYLWLK